TPATQRPRAYPDSRGSVRSVAPLPPTKPFWDRVDKPALLEGCSGGMTRLVSQRRAFKRRQAQTEYPRPRSWDVYMPVTPHASATADGRRASGLHLWRVTATQVRHYHEVAAGAKVPKARTASKPNAQLCLQLKERQAMDFGLLTGPLAPLVWFASVGGAPT
ncbi:hypothetical protein S40285_10250, partial [Stachybotrys chlorohalonatus IBT 40285]